MSGKERAIELINLIPESKLVYIIPYLEGAAIPDEDEIFCEKLYENYLNDNDPEKHETVSLDDFARQMGVRL